MLGPKNAALARRKHQHLMFLQEQTAIKGKIDKLWQEFHQLEKRMTENQLEAIGISEELVLERQAKPRARARAKPSRTVSFLADKSAAELDDLHSLVKEALRNVS